MKLPVSPFAVTAMLGVVALVGLLAYGLVQNEPDRGIEQALGRGQRAEAPAFELERLSGGGREALADYRGKVVVLNFWGSWCDPCRTESPLLERWHRRISRGGEGTVLGIDAIDVSQHAREFVREFRLSYPMLKDREGEVPAEYGVTGYPETFVLDRQGRIAALRRGPVDDAFMRAEVLPLIEEAS